MEERCRKCGGDGWVYCYEDKGDCEEASTINCPSCGGSGKA